MKYISKTKNILGGAPVISGTRIPAERLSALVELGYTEENIKKQFPGVSIKKIKGAMSELLSFSIEKL